jgi:mono/diheme cytochrome c family protein
MTRLGRYLARAIGSVLVLAAGAATPATGQEPPPHPFAPTWANLAGAKVFADKGCAKCHAIRGFGATAAPDLRRFEK